MATRAARYDAGVARKAALTLPRPQRAGARPPCKSEPLPKIGQHVVCLRADVFDQEIEIAARADHTRASVSRPTGADEAKVTASTRAIHSRQRVSPSLEPVDAEGSTAG